MTSPDTGYKPPLFGASEDLLLAIFKPLEGEINGLKVRTIIEDEATFSVPYLLCRSDTGAWTSDSFGGDGGSRFTRRAIADIQVWTADPDGDMKGAYLSELARQRLYQAAALSTVYPRLGHIAKVRTSSPANKVPDWATSTGVNQYANLARGLYRYQAKYGLIVRPDFQNPMTADDMLAVLNES